MSRPPRARESVLDAYEDVVIADGPAAATMDAVARAAGVSKGGLLYHFASKDALQSAVIERMSSRGVAEMADVAASPVGAIAAFMRSSIMHNTPFDRTIVTVSRLAQNGDAVASDALRRLRDVWEETLRPHTRDETALQLVMLVSDGLYFNNALSTGSVPGPDLDDDALAALIALVERSAV
ncbi:MULTISPECIES: TetR/AcrR family transcriptional regulator [Microbacterium]|jgi:AcrR family transcriptional regulator|uniref:TetR/AcrR family transcriptional regulator n=1 Tax=Microbacterium TaxID=33882 RepID=UPI00086C534E|nr:MULTISPECIES: TetR/AcrR family transcriptional regulator [unclassified Microbacterium]MCK9916892.1 TetR/AcrR family transcriptional regulator [Microbacteriaceae bacterium K1510]ODU77447.1 MAG: transcriptional regulator [Microbacterium sp. SCN 71-21]